MKGLVALLLGGLGLRVLLKRRQAAQPGALEPTPADELRAKLAESRAEQPVEPEPAPEVEVSGTAGRRQAVHDQARAALDELA